MGNPEELGYLQESLRKEAEQYPSARFVVHSATANDGKTNDGIAAGGSRLATEVSQLIESHKNNTNRRVTLSFVGNSLGGLYARYALSEMDWSKVEPMVFCTTATPHLGVSEHTYLPLPKWGEWVIGNALQQTGRDLFRHTSLVQDMAFDPAYRTPLQNFRRRIAYANAFATDFQVPTTTAAFLSPDSVKLNHVTVGTQDSVFTLTVQTTPDPDYHETNGDDDTIAHALDAMGWTKVFCDNRDNIPLPAVPLPFEEPEIPSKPEWSSQELIPLVTSVGNQWNFPMGHTVLVANSKSNWYARINEKGQPVVNKMAASLVEDILSLSSELHHTQSTTAKEQEAQ